ncbi:MULTISPECIES: hypothetical protein [Bradyrhizobium]|uniref:hypothetical protein n=1 Tax=Bradyrhizobium TaxID=374 RepID=UPI001ED9F45D|nr:hypothetical protein [Bradyrhizobium zhengyangense]MCG2645717.1 hypothetical protein [Bradyrhizobium zhengyangense]
MSEKIEPINDLQFVELIERIHEIAKHLKRLQQSQFWSVQTFTVRDVVADLDRKQQIWLTSFIEMHLRIWAEFDVLKLPVKFAANLQAADDEIYAIQIVPAWLREDDRDGKVSARAAVSLLTAHLKFVTIKRNKIMRNAA